MVIKASENGDLAPRTVNHITNNNADLNNESRLQARHMRDTSTNHEIYSIYLGKL